MEILYVWLGDKDIREKIEEKSRELEEEIKGIENKLLKKVTNNGVSYEVENFREELKDKIIEKENLEYNRKKLKQQYRVERQS